MTASRISRRTPTGITAQGRPETTVVLASPNDGLHGPGRRPV
ncbi:hypothetical protein [Embleya sp. NPDC001921]